MGDIAYLLIGEGRLFAEAGWFALPEPRRGGMIIAPGKAAEAAARGKKPPLPTFFPFWFGAPARQTRREKRKDHFGSVTQGGAALALGYYHIVLTGLQFGSLHSHIGRTISAATPGHQRLAAIRRDARYKPRRNRRICSKS